MGSTFIRMHSFPFSSIGSSLQAAAGLHYLMSNHHQILVTCHLFNPGWVILLVTFMFVFLLTDLVFGLCGHSRDNSISTQYSNASDEEEERGASSSYYLCPNDKECYNLTLT